MNEKLSEKEKNLSNKELLQTALKPTKTARKKPRKKRKRKKRLFDETRVGHFLKHEAPLEYGLIMEAGGGVGAPSADLIEAIGYASINPLFKKPKFRRALIDYRKNGLHTGQPKKSNAKLELFYSQMRRRNMQKALNDYQNLNISID